MGVGGRAARDCEPPVPILSSKHGQQGSQGGHCPPHSQEAGRAPSGDQGPSSSGVRPGLWVANSCLSPWTWRYRGPVFARHSAQRHPTHQTGVGTAAPPSPDVPDTHSRQRGREKRVACLSRRWGRKGQVPPRGSLPANETTTSSGIILPSAHTRCPSVRPSAAESMRSSCDSSPGEFWDGVKDS